MGKSTKTIKYYTREILNNFFSKYTNSEWFYIKLSLVITIWPGLIYKLFTLHGQPYPVGVCRLFNCAAITVDPIRYIMAGLLLFLAIAYLMEKKMFWVTISIFCIVLILLTLQESNGQKGRSGLLSLFFLAQSLAYYLSNRITGFDLNKYRVQFCAQFIAGVYTLAGFSKVMTSGLSWIEDAPNIALQMIKSYRFEDVNLGGEVSSQNGLMLVNWVESYPFVIQFLLGTALLIELGAFVLLISKKWAFFYSFLLLSMHLGIYFMLHITFPTVTEPLVILFINPLYLLTLPIKRLFGKKNIA